MYKYLITFVIAFMVVNLIGIEIGLAYDYSVGQQIENHKGPYWKHYVDVNPGISPYIEFLAPHARYFYRPGIGVEYQFPRKIQDNEHLGAGEGWFSFLPIYVTNKTYILIVPETVELQLSFNMGYNFFFTDKSYLQNTSRTGGIFYSYGVGLHIKDILIGCQYKENNGKVDGSSPARLIYNKQWGFSIGWSPEKTN